MNVPKSFKSKIKSVFYDKTLTRHDVSNAKDDEGWDRLGDPVATGTFLASVKFSELSEVQEAYGIHTDIAFTANTDADITLGEIVGYNGNLYRVAKAIPFDSHNMLICEEWSSKSSTSISA